VLVVHAALRRRVSDGIDGIDIVDLIDGKSPIKSANTPLTSVNTVNNV
jgi:hypothetical protein